MKIIYDKETDTLSIILRAGKVAESDEVREGLIFDFSIPRWNARLSGIAPEGQRRTQTWHSSQIFGTPKSLGPSRRSGASVQMVDMRHLDPAWGVRT